MSATANWSYTATATIWRRIRDADGSDTDGGGQPYGWEAPIAILCDYQGGLSAKIGDLGREMVVKNTIWTEYATARKGITFFLVCLYLQTHLMMLMKFVK